jgi:hypothetical protein
MKFHKLPSTPPEGSVAKSVMTLEVEVDSVPQELNKLCSFERMLLTVPAELSNEGQTVFKALCDCFDKAKAVQEGKVRDLVWGFEQAGHPVTRTFVGLQNLSTHGYVMFQSPGGGSFVKDLAASSILDYWIRYQPKFKKLIYV